MKASNKVRFGAGLAAAVLAVVLFPITAKSQDKPAPPEKAGAEARSLRREMARDLFAITPEQEKRLQELRDAQMKDARAFREQMTKMRGEMRDLMKDPQANAAKIDSLIDSRARLRAEREKQALRFRSEREKTFTLEQIEKMKRYRGELRERFGARAAWPGGPGRLGMGRLMGARAALGWRMRVAAWRWRHPFCHRFW